MHLLSDILLIHEKCWNGSPRFLQQLMFVLTPVITGTRNDTVSKNHHSQSDL